MSIFEWLLWCILWIVESDGFIPLLTVGIVFWIIRKAVKSKAKNEEPQQQVTAQSNVPSFGASQSGAHLEQAGTSVAPAGGKGSGIQAGIPSGEQSSRGTAPHNSTAFAQHGYPENTTTQRIDSELYARLASLEGAVRDLTGLLAAIATKIPDIDAATVSSYITAGQKEGSATATVNPDDVFSELSKAEQGANISAEQHPPAMTDLTYAKASIAAPTLPLATPHSPNLDSVEEESATSEYSFADTKGDAQHVAATTRQINEARQDSVLPKDPAVQPIPSHSEVSGLAGPKQTKYALSDAEHIGPQQDGFEQADLAQATALQEGEALSSGTDTEELQTEAVASSAKEDQPETVTSPALHGQPEQDRPSFLGRLYNKLKDMCGEPFTAVVSFIRGGNLWVMAGVIMLLIGFAFLAKLGVFPISTRIAGATIAGIVMVGFGVHVRNKRRMYSLILQGGGIAILYLSAFAAAKLADILPDLAALVLMVALVIPSVILAVVQRAQILAVVGFVGGFAAPILLSDGSGNFVGLFSFYTLLNIGILVIGRFQYWRGLNFAGLLCTFVVMGTWILSFYEPSLFTNVLPFLFGFILIYVLITLIAVKKEDFSYSKSLDMIQACALPFVAALFMWCLGVGIPHALSISAIGFGVFFLGLAILLWKVFSGNARQLAEIYLIYGIVFANLAIPLELSGNITAASWALEGGLLFFFAYRFDSFKLKWLALALQGVGVIAFFWDIALQYSFIDGILPTLIKKIGLGTYLLSDVGIAKHTWLSSSFIAAAALLSAIVQKRQELLAAPLSQLFTTKQRREKDEYKAGANPGKGHTLLVNQDKNVPFFAKPLSCLLIRFALVWWYAGLAFDLLRFSRYPYTLFIGITAVSGVILQYLADREGFVKTRILAFLVPITSACAVILVQEMYPLFRSYNQFKVFFLYRIDGATFVVAWSAFILAVAIMLYRSKNYLAPRFHAFSCAAYILVTVLTITSILRGVFYTLRYEALVLHSTAQLQVQLYAFGFILSTVLPSLVFIILAMFYFLKRKAHSQIHLFVIGGLVPLVLFVGLGAWGLITSWERSFSILPMYIPILTPLEFAQLLCLATFALWLLKLFPISLGTRLYFGKKLFLLLDALAFYWLHTVLARAICYYAQLTPNNPFVWEAIHHPTYQMLLTVLWGVWGMAHLIVGNRLRIRYVWLIGALLIVANTAKVFLVDLADRDTLFRVISFFVMGGIFLLIGWLAPLPTNTKKAGSPFN